MEMLAYASWSQRIRHFLLNGLAFGLCYQTSNSLAEKHHITRNAALVFDAYIPFLDWMIIPYLCSGFFFVWCFIRVVTRADLRVFSQRMLLATVIASLIFVFYPLRFSMPRPDIASPFMAKLFKLLSLYDRPYNQLPSLHIAYCLIFWKSLSACFKSRTSKLILAVALMLIAVSTLFTYQHHLLDIVAGAMLGSFVIAVIKLQQAQIHVAFYYAIIAAIVFIVGVAFYHSWIAAYLVASLLLVSHAYQHQNRHFLRKKRGRHSMITCLLYAPYLTGYWLTWQMVRYRERHQPIVKKFADNLWVGRRLSQNELKLLPENCFTIDLSPELSEIKYLSSQNYQHYPLLDLREPDIKAMSEIAETIQQEIQRNRNIYLHCAMGYHRCMAVATFTMAKINS
jgi:membrane-associated phospholipid phosphatase/rhodanese-related sulfurtransferase